MIRRLSKNQSGYSLVEVMVAIMILAIAIIPMVGMFDAGLRAATQGSNYDKARSLAGKQLEIARGRPYLDVRDNYPVVNTPPDPSTGIREINDNEDPDFLGFEYDVRKEYVALVGTSIQPGPEARSTRRMMQVTVTVRWTGGDYSTTGLVRR